MSVFLSSFVVPIGSGCCNVTAKFSDRLTPSMRTTQLVRGRYRVSFPSSVRRNQHSSYRIVQRRYSLAAKVEEAKTSVNKATRRTLDETENPPKKPVSWVSPNLFSKVKSATKKKEENTKPEPRLPRSQFEVLSQHTNLDHISVAEPERYVITPFGERIPISQFKSQFDTDTPAPSPIIASLFNEGNTTAEDPANESSTSVKSQKEESDIAQSTPTPLFNRFSKVRVSGNYVKPPTMEQISHLSFVKPRYIRYDEEDPPELEQQLEINHMLRIAKQVFGGTISWHKDADEGFKRNRSRRKAANTEAKDEVADNLKKFDETLEQTLRVMNLAPENDIIEETDDLPSVCVCGRSNVGKSSLLNALLSTRIKPLRVSKTPGRTQTVQYVNVDEKLVLVDLPGYGYAELPETVRKDLKLRIEAYFHLRTPKRVFVLIDSRRGLTETDIPFLKLLDERRLPYQFVLTKIDKVSPTHVKNAQYELLELSRRKSCAFPFVLATSAKTREGITTMQLEILQACGILDKM